MAGIIGISLNRGCWEELQRAVTYLRPIRGDKHIGFALLAQNKIYHINSQEEESVDRLFKRALAEDPTIKEAQVAIGGVDYQDYQPIFIEKSRIGPFALVGDVKIVNREELQKEYSYLVGSDLRICAGLIASGEDPVDSLGLIFNKVQGRYNLGLLTLDGLFACKDPRGFRSLAIARNEDGCCAFSSESAALGAAFDETKSDLIREVYPKEIIQVESTGFKTLKSGSLEGLTICTFDIGYGQGPASIFEDIDIGLARFLDGETLARKYGVEAENVFSFPLSGDSAGEGYAAESKIHRIGLWQYNPIGRSYPPISEEERKRRGKGKYSPIRWVLRAFKTHIGVDDSIVEGNQLLTRLFLLLRLLERFHPFEFEEKKSGIHLRIACPPKVNACPLEVPFRPVERLFAATRDKETMKRVLGLLSLEFNTISDHGDSILRAQSEKRKQENPLKPENLCLTCHIKGEDLVAKYFK